MNVLSHHLKPVILKNKQTLYESANPNNYVYFRSRRLFRVVVLMEDGAPPKPSLIGL